MNRKQFVNLVAKMQNAACESSWPIISRRAGKYDYICIRHPHVYIDWEIRRRIRGTETYYLYAMHDIDHKAWVVHEGDEYHVWTDTELERWRTE